MAERVNAGESVDFEAVLAEAKRLHVCAWCGGDLAPWQRVTAAFSSPGHSSRFRDRRRYWENPEAARARAREYYAANREAVLAKAAAKRGREAPPELTACSQCGDPLEGRQRLTCGRAGCRDARFKRLHPESYAAREAAKVDRRREKRRAARAS